MAAVSILKWGGVFYERICTLVQQANYSYVCGLTEIQGLFK